MSDRNTAVSYAIMAIITNSKLEIHNFDNKKMDAFLDFLKNVNAPFEINHNTLIILPHTELSSIFIKAFLYPEFHSDWQPLIAPLFTQINGHNRIEELLFPDRLGYCEQLNRMNAKCEYDYNFKTRFNNNKPHAVDIYGKRELFGANVIANDLRGGMALIIASLVAKGITTIDNYKEVKRGYENITSNLQ